MTKRRFSDRRMVPRIAVALLRGGLLVAAAAAAGVAASLLLGQYVLADEREGLSMESAGMKGEPLTVAQIEAANLYPDDGRIPHVPFGFANDRWTEFKAQMRPGDLIYSYASAPESWKALAGRAGYVLVRAGEPIAEMVTIMN